MRFSAVALSTIVAVASARGLVARQDDASASTDAAPSATTSLTPQASCLASCDAGDVDCAASCVGTAHPNADDTQATTECAANCDQGDGSPEATDKYSQCVQGCISSHFPTTGTAAPGAVGGAATGAASASASATSAGATGSGSSGSTATATGSSSSSTGSSSSSDSDSDSSDSSSSGSSASASGSSASETGAASLNGASYMAGVGALFMAGLAL